jgi:hypothetical protein
VDCCLSTGCGVFRSLSVLPLHAFCWKKFYVQTDEPGHRDERESLQYGFRTDDGNTWVCEDCYYAVRDILEFTAEVP